MTLSRLTIAVDGPSARPSWTFRPWPQLAGLLLLAVVLRLAWIAVEPGGVQHDECEYMRLARNLLADYRYEGLYEGPQVIYPPLFPILIALSAIVTRDPQIGALAIGVLSGMALVVAMYALARRLYGRRAALLAAGLGACFPLLVELSGSILSQTIYLPLLVAGVVFGLQWLEDRGRSASVACGACFGLAYLTRPEAIAAPLILAAWFVATASLGGTSMGQALRRATSVLAVVAILASPYVVYLWMHSHSLRFEGKSTMNFVIAERVNSGMSLSEAQWGLDASLHEAGPLLSPNRWILEAPPTPPLTDVAGFWLRNAQRTAAELRWIFTSGQFGGPLTGVLACIGWIRSMKTREQAMPQLVVSMLVGGYALLLLGQHQVIMQYAIPLLPFVLVWAAGGIEIAAQKIHGLIFGAWGSRGLSHAARYDRGVATVLVALCLVPAAQGFSDGGEFKSVQRSMDYRKEAGLWLLHHGATGRVMSAGNEVPYYADAVALRFPHAPEDAALAYIRLKAPDYLVLIRERWTVGSYYETWRKHGVPDPAALPLLRRGADDDPDIAIYGWRTSASD